MMFKVSPVIFLATLTFSNTILPSSSQNEVEWYCATECVTDDVDPCGDQAGQRATCTTPGGIVEKANLGYNANDTLPPGGFLGCTRSSCAGFCSSSSSSSAVIANNGSLRVLEATTGDRKLFCFDGTTTMFENRDHAEMSAISRGCEGSHAMGSNYMHGSGHGTCSSYRENGVSYNGDDTTRYVDGRDGEWSNRIPYQCIDAAVGDELVFRVTSNHDLYRLNDFVAYNDCDFTGATLVAGVGAGEVSVPLDASGDYYFACSIGEHCSNDHSGHDHDHDHDHGDAEDSMLYAQKVYVSVGGDDGVSCEEAMMAAPEEESSSAAESSSATSSNNNSGTLRMLFAVLFALM